MGNEGSRIAALAASNFKKPTEWKSARTGHACSGSESGHIPDVPEDLVERTEQKIIGRARCLNCGDEVLYAPTENTREAPVVVHAQIFKDALQQKMYEEQQLRSKARLEDREEQYIIDKVEAAILGRRPPLLPGLDGHKTGPDLNEGAPTVADPEAVRRFRALHGRAPTIEELRKLPRRK
jgi:hypothetical protein